MYILATLSEREIDGAVILLNTAIVVDTLSVNDITGDNVLMALYILDILSDVVVLSVNPLSELYILDRLSLIELLSDILLNVSIIPVTPSVDDTVCEIVLRAFNSLVTPSDNVILSDTLLLPANVLATESVNDTAPPVIDLNDSSILVATSVDETVSLIVLNRLDSLDIPSDITVVGEDMLLRAL